MTARVVRLSPALACPVCTLKVLAPWPRHDEWYRCQRHCRAHFFVIPIPPYQTAGYLAGFLDDVAFLSLMAALFPTTRGAPLGLVASEPLTFEPPVRQFLSIAGEAEYREHRHAPLRQVASALFPRVA